MRASRYFAAGELVVIVLPLTLMALWGAVLTIPMSLAALADDWKTYPFFLLAIFCAIGLISLLSGTLLLASFVRHGRPGLDMIHRNVWVLCGLGGAIALAGGIASLLGEGIGLSIGLPAILPLGHMCFERRRTDG
ncbi:hypothetical protein [Lysobacter fragariae]